MIVDCDRRLARGAGLWHKNLMNADELKSLLNASPFRPFTIYTAAEKAFPIRHPDFVVVTPRGRTVIVLHAENDAFDILDIPLISRIEVHDPATSAS